MTAPEDIALEISQQLHRCLKDQLAPHRAHRLVRSIALHSITTLSAIVLADVLRGWDTAQQDRMMATFAAKVRDVAEELIQTHASARKD